MSFLKKLFGAKDEPAPKPPPRPAAPPPSRAPAPPARPAPQEGPGGPPDMAQADVKQLLRYLGSSNRETRDAAAERLGQLNDRTAMRPLFNAYLNYGDPPILEALAPYGEALGPVVAQEADDMGIMGDRRARLMDVAAVSHDPDTMKACRDNLEYPDPNVAVRAGVALSRLGDLSGVDALAKHLERPDPDYRLAALRGLVELSDIAQARKAVQDHLDRYLAESGAVPQQIQVSAPRLVEPTAGMVNFIAQRVDAEPHSLTVVVGSDSVRMASTRRDEIIKALTGHQVFFAMPQMPPEEQIDALRQARDMAAANPEAKVIFFGKIPAPHDNPPLPHVLTRATKAYTAKLMLVDPHELMLAMDWYHYVTDNAEVPTDTEIVLSVSRPGQSAISEEEMLLYELVAAEKKDQFVRAWLAHL